MILGFQKRVAKSGKIHSVDTEGQFMDALNEKGLRTILVNSPLLIEDDKVIAVREPGLIIDASHHRCVIRSKRFIAAVSHVYIRSVAFECNSDTLSDCFQVFNSSGAKVKNITLDQCAIMWGSDENFGCVNADRITLNRCLIAEGLLDHSAGGLVYDTSRFALLNSVLAHNAMRNMRPGGNTTAVMSGNLIYNHGGTPMDCVGDTGPCIVTCTNNWFVPGPDTPKWAIEAPKIRARSPKARVYAAFNDYGDKGQHGDATKVGGAETFEGGRLVNRMRVWCQGTHISLEKPVNVVGPTWPYEHAHRISAEIEARSGSITDKPIRMVT